MALRKILAFAGVASLGVILAGCGGGGGDETTPAPKPPAPVPTPAPTPPAPVPGPVKVATIMVNISADMDFTCLHTPKTCESGTNENVLMIHGWPERKEFFQQLMENLADKNYCGLACDMHGYSPGASPVDKSKYEYDILRDQSFQIAKSAGFSKFHLVGHDHGAILGWRMAASKIPADKIMVQSYIAISVPHPDAVSKALFGDDVDVNQQVASQYFALFVSADSANLKMNTAGGAATLFDVFKCTHPTRYTAERPCFETAEDFQKTLYWYSGLFTEGSKQGSLPPDFDLDFLVNSTSPGKGWAIAIRQQNPDMNGMGSEQDDATGDIDVPTLFICGTEDDALMCAADWAKTSGNYCKDGYTELDVMCTHWPLSADDCKTAPEGGAAESKKVYDAILKHLADNPVSVAQLRKFV